jgi:cytochrome c-type biogenesis protein CcmE
MIDEAGEEKKVVYRAPEPADFERSEKIVIIGNINGEVFEADKILLKCPSKYNEGEIPKG